MREASYNFEAIHTTLNELAAGQPEKAIAAVEKRHAELARASWACLAALTSFHEYIREFYEEALASLYSPSIFC
jgi:predicted negative regulator of RcsB-dependent stress response